jgi:hypothetical protein
MKNNHLLEYSILGALAFASFVLLDPLHWWMPSMVQMTALAGLVAAFAVFAAFLIREGAQDEREEQLRSTSGRTGFLLGAGVLVVGIAVQGYLDMLDHWLVYALLAMIFGKIAARIYAERL